MEVTAVQRVANTVRAELARRRITQVELATALELSQPAVSRRLRGEVPFDIQELDAVGRLLGLPLASLTGGATTSTAA